MTTPQPSNVRTQLFLIINSMTLAQAAQAYAAMGMRVFPLQPGTKLPMPGWPWKKIATTDPNTIASWWQQWPEANIALALGMLSRADALDVDVKGNQEGVRSYQAITQESFPGPVQRTPTGGNHLILGHTPGLKNFTHKGQLGGLDMRTDGGYIVVAPSRIPGVGMYEWIQDGPIIPPPPALLQACRQWSTQSNTQTLEAPDIPEDLVDYHQLGIPQKYIDYLDRGETAPWDSDESRAIFAVAGALQKRLQDPGMVFGILANNMFAWACAERHRPFGSVADWLWTYGIGKIVQSATRLDPGSIFSPVPGYAGQGTPVGVSNFAPSIETGPVVAPEASAPGFFVRADLGMGAASLAPKWLVRGLMECGQVGLLYGDSQALKSYLALDLAASIASSRPWHGHNIPNPGPVWFLAGEGNMILWRRLSVLRQQRAISPEELKTLWISSGGLNLMDPRHLQFLQEQIRACGDLAPALIIIDTLSTNAILDENSARDIAQMIQILHGMAQAWGCSVLFLHHAAKGNNRSARGSSAIQANTDFRYRLERIPGKRILTQFYVEKLKGAPEPTEQFVFEGSVHPIMGLIDDEMAPVTDLVLNRLSNEYVEELKTARATARLTNRQAEVFDVVKKVFAAYWVDHGPAKGILRDELITLYRAIENTHKSHLDTQLDKLIKHGVLEIAHEGRHEILYMREMAPG